MNFSYIVITKMKKMKKIILLVSVLVLTSSCNQPVEKASTSLNDNYSKNLATAQKFFDLFLTEDIEAQKPLICPGVTLSTFLWI